MSVDVLQLFQEEHTLCVNFVELMTSITLKAAQLMSYPSIWSCTDEGQYITQRKDTHICQLCNSIRLDAEVILTKFLFDLLHTLGDVFGFILSVVSDASNQISEVLVEQSFEVTFNLPKRHDYC